MNRLIDFTDGENNYRVPESEVETFKASVPNARQMSQFVGKDGSRYSVPEDEIEAFKASVPDAEAVNRFQLSNGERYTVQQSRMSKFLRSRQYREGDADAIAAKRAEIDAATPEVDAQGVASAAAEAALKGGVRTVGKYGRAFTGMVTDPLRLAGMIFGGRNNALVKGMDWINDKWDWFSEDLGVGLSGGDKTQDALSSFGEMSTSGIANIMPWLIGGGVASKGARMALKGVNSLAAGGNSSTDTYDELKANGADEEIAYLGALAAGAVSTAFAYTFGTVSAGNFLKGAGAKGAAKLIAEEVVAKKKGFNEIVRAVANGRMRGDIMNFLVGAAEEGVTEGAESFVLNVLKQHGSGEDVDLEEALLKALPDAAAGAALGGVMTGARAIEWAKNGGPRKFYEKQARAEVSQLMNDMAPGDIREMNPKAFDAAAKKRRLGGTVSRKDGEEIGLPPNWTQEQRNEVIDEWNQEQTARKEKRAKMDGQQEMALREDIKGFVGEGPEAQRVYDRVTMKLKDASVLDDPYQREKLVMQAAEAVWNEDQAQRVGGARQKARMAEKADHEARVAETEAQAAEAAQRAENDAQERENAKALAREEKKFAEGEKQYIDFMLAYEEARAKGGQNETRADETQQKSDEAQSVTPPAGEAARPLEAGKAPSEVGGEVTAPKTAVEAPTSASTETKVITAERAERNFDAVDAVSTPTKPKTVREGKAFVNSNIGKQYTDGKKTYEIAGLTKDGEVSVKVTGKDGKSSEAAIKLSGALTRIFGTKKINAVWSEVETPKTEQNVPKVEVADKKTAHEADSASEKRQTHAEAVEELAKSAGKNISNLGEVRPPKPKVGAKPGYVTPAKKLDTKSVVSALKNVASKDSSRPSLNRVHIENGEMVATDGRMLIHAKAPKGVSDGEYGTTKVGEAKIDEAYFGNPKSVFNLIAKRGYREVGTIENGDTSADAIHFSAALHKAVSASHDVTLRVGDANLNGEFTKSIVNAMFRLGCKDIKVLVKDAKSPVVFKGKNADGEVTGMQMPLYFSEDVDIKKSTHVRIFGENATTTKTKPKTAPKSEPKAEAKTEPKTDAKAEPKTETAPSITPAEAMKKLGSLGAADVDTLTKALAREERAGHTERANMIRVLRDYKRGVGTNENPQSDETSGGKYRASVEAAKPLDDPAFVAWAKKRGVAPTTQKRNEYDKAMADTLTNRLSRWIKGVTVNTVNFIAPEEGGDVRAAKEVKAESDSKSALGEIAKGKDYGVLHNNTYGEIKYPLGRPGKKGMGFLHIVEHRMNEGASLDEAIDVALKVGIAAEIGTETKNVLNTRHLDYDGVRAIIAIQNGNVIVTGYEIDADENTAAIRRAAKHNPHPHVGSDEVISALRKKLSATENSLSQSTAADKSVRLLHDGERIVGSYNRATGEVKLAKGASVETVLHEIGWHAARHWAEANADSDMKAANLLNQMKEYAESAPKEIKDAVRDTYGEMSADTLLDEIGAARFTKEQSGKIAKALATKEGAAWYKKIGDKVKEFFKNFLTKIGYNRVDLDGVENMSPEVFGDFLADVMMSGKQLGERTAFSMEAPKGLAAKWTNNLSDYKAPIAELEKRTTGSSNNIYYLARTLEGQAQRGKNRAERAIKRVEKILGEDISPELLAQYMQLKAYEERNAKIERRNNKKDASGMTPEDAKTIEKTINESGVDEAIFEEAAQILWDLQTEGLQARVDAGLLDQETANKWMTDEPHHIPWKDAVDPDSGEYVGRRMGASEFDTAEGRKTAASGDPITWLLQEYQDAMTRAAQNRLRSSIANLTRFNGDVGIIYDGIQTDSKGKRSFIKYPRGGGKAKVLSIPEGVKIESTVKNDGGMKNVLTFKEGGETKYLVLNGSLGEAVAGAVTGRTLSRPPALISWVMRGYAATATSLSPAFAARNITADNFDIHNNLVAKYGWVKGEKMFGKVVKEQVLMTKQLGSYIKNGDFKLDKDGKATDFQKLVEAYEDAGGLIGGMATEGYDATVKKIQADFRAGRNKARSIGKSVAAYWTMMQRMSELAPRLAVFKTAMESGMSAKDAAMLSRDITVDFNKKGAKTPWFNTLFMFSNSALGANLTQMKGLAGKTGAKLAGGLVMYGFAEGLLEALMNGDDDEREKEGLATGEDINEYTRQNSLYIRRGDKVFRVNIHMGPFAYAKYFGNVMARTFSGMISPEKAAKELGLTAAEVAASFTGLGNVSGDALVQTAVPTVLQPFVQMATNKDYAGRAVYRAKFTESKPDSAHGRKSTAAGYHWAASFLNELTGGNEARKGAIDVAPETVKMLTEMVGKNFARDIMEIAETGYKLLNGNAKDLDVRNVPFAGDFARTHEGNDNRFYENYNRYRDDKYELKNNSDLKGDERRAYLRAHPWLYSAGKPGVTRIDNIVKRIEKLRDVEESDRATEERKAEAKATRRRLQARVIEIMKGK